MVARHSGKIVIILGVVLVVAYFLYSQSIVQPSQKPVNTLSYISLPTNFKIEVFAEDLGNSDVSYPGPNTGPRMMLFKDGVLHVTIPSQGRVVALPDQNRDHKADSVITVIDGLNKPHGIDYYNSWFYIAEENRVVRVRGGYGAFADTSTLEKLVDLPAGGHFTRTVKIYNESLYISVGSSCNVCYENEEMRAAITRCNLDGTQCATYARGLRNAVGFVFDSGGILYATDNGRDWLGDDAPPDEINIVEEGKDYGWPICYGQNIHDTDFDKNTYVRDPCEDATPSLLDLQAHSAPLGLAVYNGNSFPEEYKDNLFVAYHGSWNRGEPTGYKVVTIDLETRTVRDFATGWLQDTNVLGRPVDVVVAEDGSLYVSDDNAGKIYRIYYTG